jgi:hypothetical protein
MASEQFLIKNVRINYFNNQLLEKRCYDKEEEKNPDARRVHKIEALIPKNTAEGKAMHKMLDDALRAEAKSEGGTDKGFKYTLYDGDERDPAKYPDYVDHWYISASSQYDIEYFDKNGPLSSMDYDKFYPGCICNLQVCVNVNKKTKWVSFCLNKVQFDSDADKIKGGGSSETLFEVDKAF